MGGPRRPRTDQRHVLPAGEVLHQVGSWEHHADLACPDEDAHAVPTVTDPLTGDADDASIRVVHPGQAREQGRLARSRRPITATS